MRKKNPTETKGSKSQRRSPSQTIKRQPSSPETIKQDAAEIILFSDFIKKTQKFLTIMHINIKL